MKLLLIGEIGIGKTTVCEEVVDKATKRRIKCVGILTEKVEEKGKNTTLVVKELSTGERRTLAYRKPIDNLEVPNGIHFCDFVFNVDTIEFAKKAVRKSGDLLIIDEIGRLELEGNGISNAISAFESLRNKNSILVVRKELKDHISSYINCSFKIVEVNKENREKMPEIIFGDILQAY